MKKLVKSQNTKFENPEKNPEEVLLRDDGIIIGKHKEVLYMPKNCYLDFNSNSDTFKRDKNGDPVIKDVYNSNIVILGLSTRTNNILLNNGITTLKDICSFGTEAELSRVKGIGQRAAREIINGLNRYGLYLGYKEKNIQYTLVRLISKGESHNVNVNAFTDIEEAKSAMSKDYETKSKKYLHTTTFTMVKERSAKILLPNGDFIYWSIDAIKNKIK